MAMVTRMCSSGSWNGKIAWHENTDGAGTFGPEQVITTSATGVQQVVAADLDGDGDLDLLSASTNGNVRGHPAKIAWFENTDGAGTFGSKRFVSQDVFGSVSIFAADMDADGDVDILATSPSWASIAPSKVVWYENTDGAGTFAIENVVSTPGCPADPRSVSAADLDGDGDLDVLCGVRVDIAWYENTDGAGTFGTEVVITSNNIGPQIREVLAADLDGDKDQDLLATSNGDKLAWFENTDGLGTFGPQRVISRDFDAYPDSFDAVDLDGDGDLDVLVAFGTRDPDTSKIVWYENTDGAGNFGSERVISRDVLNPRSIDAADLDGDGDLDVLSTTRATTESFGTRTWTESAVSDLSRSLVQTFDLRGRSWRPIWTATATRMSWQVLFRVLKASPSSPGSKTWMEPVLLDPSK